MNTVDELNLMYVLLLSNALLVAAAAIAILRFQKMIDRNREFWASPTGTSLAKTQPDAEPPRANPVAATDNGAIQGELAALQNVVARISDRQQRAVARPEHSVPMDNAVRMARQGASVEELTRNCGVSIGEAQLIRKMHGSDMAASAH